MLLSNPKNNPTNILNSSLPRWQEDSGKQNKKGKGLDREIVLEKICVCADAGQSSNAINSTKERSSLAIVIQDTATVCTCLQFPTDTHML